MTAHGAAKAGVLGLTRQLATEGAPHRVRVNAISPGFVDTPATRDMPQHIKDYILSSIHLIPAAIEPIDIAYCALYLASDESRFVTGVDLVVDAGSEAGRAAPARRLTPASVQPNSSLLASCAPCAMRSSLAHSTRESMRMPQSVPAMTFSLPTTFA